MSVGSVVVPLAGAVVVVGVSIEDAVVASDVVVGDGVVTSTHAIMPTVTYSRIRFDGSKIVSIPHKERVMEKKC